MDHTETSLSDQRWDRLVSLYSLSPDDRKLVERIVSDIRVSDEVEQSLTYFDPTSADPTLLANRVSKPSVILQDTEWHQIVACSLLPDACRMEVDDIVDRIAKLSLVERSSELASRKRLMSRAAARAAMLAGEIEQIQQASCGECGVAEERLRRELAAYADHLKQRMDSFRPGRKHDGKIEVIEAADRLLRRHVGRPIRLGAADDDGFAPFEFLGMLFHIGGSAVSVLTLSRLVRRYLDSGRRSLQEWSWDTWSEEALRT